MNELDAALDRLAHAPLPHRLAFLEQKVLAQIASRPVAARTSVGVAGMTVVAALMIGVVGGGVSASAVQTPSLSPLGSSTSLAPSTLLIGSP